MRTLKINKATAERWLQTGNQELKDLALQTYPELGEPKLPETWEELEKIDGFYIKSGGEVTECLNLFADEDNRNIFSTKEQAEAAIALAQLSQLREVYRKGWTPDWNGNGYKWCITFDSEKLIVGNWVCLTYFLSFQDRKTANLFLKNFKDLIIQARPLLS